MEERIAIWTTVPGPWGPFHVAATRDGVVAVEWFTTGPSLEARLRRRLGGDPRHVVDPDVADPDGDEPARSHLVSAVAALGSLLDGRPPRHDVSFDLADRPGWDRRVLAAVAGIGWGHTASYGEIARRIGAPRAARAVGGAVGRNPVGLLIPCHRVVAADGTIGGYGGDAWGGREERIAMKRDLLRREGIEIPTG